MSYSAAQNNRKLQLLDVAMKTKDGIDQQVHDAIASNDNERMDQLRQRLMPTEAPRASASPTMYEQQQQRQQPAPAPAPAASPKVTLPPNWQKASVWASLSPAQKQAGFRAAGLTPAEDAFTFAKHRQR